MEEPPRLSPVLDRERIDSLDVLRGVAVLGILIMNIVSMGMISAAYFNPHGPGDAGGLDYSVWLAGHLVADQKFMSIFSILFGAGVVIFTERLGQRGRKPAGLHYRRMGWLLLFGMLHAYLLWFGDILFTYAICGMLVYLLRRLPPRWLIPLAAVLFVVPIGLNLLTAWSTQFWPDDAFYGVQKGWAPTTEYMNEEIETYRASWLAQMSHRAVTAAWMQTFLLFFWTLWRVSACMLLGMALLKTGVLAAKRSSAFYLMMLILGVTTGTALTLLGVRSNTQHEWDAVHGMFIGMNYNYVGSIFTALGWIGLIMLVCKAPRLRQATRPFAAVGRMAFTNYIMQTVLCTTLFYGHGLGFYNTLSRFEMFGVVIAIWIAQLIISPIWLRYFRFGPLEWLWRTLSYWRPQPLRRHHDEGVPTMNI
jgi:uncharacterized protein